MPSSRRAAAISVRAARAAELLERHAEIHDLHLRRAGSAARRTTNSAVLLRHGQRDVGGRLEQPVGDLLEPGRVGQVRVLVQDRRDAARARPPAGRTSWRRSRACAGCRSASRRRARSIAGSVSGSNLPRSRYVMSIPSASRVSSERSFFRRLTSETLKRVAVEPRDHPAEQPLDPVHPRPLPAEVVADLKDVERYAPIPGGPPSRSGGERLRQTRSR